MGLKSLVTLAALGFFCSVAAFAETPVERGKYLVTIAGCSDCHTPGNFLGHPDFKRFLGGSDVGFGIPNAGVFVGPNLTPDMDTGIGKWSVDDIVVAITRGKTPEGRSLSPIMPWPAFSQLSRSDAEAIAAYLKSLPPIVNKIPGPFKPDEKPSVLVMTVIPGEVYAAMPKPPK
jgi:mono/diheme cytochrome c family protein